MKKIDISQIATKLYSSKTFEEMDDVPERGGLKTGITKIDDDFGFPTGYYIIIGNQGVGKSWFALWLSRVFHKHNGVSSVYFSLEMPEMYVRKRILQQWSDLTKSEVEKGVSTAVAKKALADDPLVVDEFFSEDTSQRTPENFIAWVDEYYRMGFRVFHFDHFHEIGGASTNETNQSIVEKWGSTFQGICKKYPDIWLILFAQPKASAFEKDILDRNSLRGGKALIDKCDYVMSLNRSIPTNKGADVVEAEDDRSVIVYLDKTRYTEKPNIGFKIYFAYTGNFFQIERSR
jgi:KaiC/GvpD/RAD55 family RecA-like ATPase